MMVTPARTALAALAALVLLLALPARGGIEREIPSEEALWAAAGESYAQGEDKSAAMQQYRLFVNSYGKSHRAARAQYMVAECYFAIEDYAAALTEYGRVEKHGGCDDHLRASVLLRQGECAFNLGRFEDAIERWSRLLDRYEDSFLRAEALYELGLAYIVVENWLKLESAYRDLLEARPGYRDLPPVKFALGLFAYHDRRYEEASGYFAEVPTDRGLYYLGRCLEDTGQYILAIQRYRQVLREYPDSPLRDDVAFSVAESFYRSGQNAVAVASYRSFIEEYPESPFVPNARYKMACVTYQEGRFDESIRQLDAVCEAFRGDIVCAYAGYLKGDCHMHLGQTAEAIFAWTDVVRSFGQSPVASAALHKIVYAYAEDENWGQAIQMAQEFLRRFPGDPLAARVRVLQGYAHMELDEPEAAVLAFQNVLDKHVNTEVAERALFLSTLTQLSQGQSDRVITSYNFLASRLLPTPSHWRARTYFHLGEAYYAQGLYKQAEGMYRLVLTGYPRSNVAAPSLQGLVASLSQLGEYELALQEQERFLLALANADSEEGSNALAVGSIYFNQHKYEEALREFTDFLQKHADAPEAAAALLNQGGCYYRLQYYDQALSSWSDLMARFAQAPEAEEALYRIADTQFGLGRFEEARASYRKLMARAPQGPRAADAAFGIANCAYNLGQDSAAIEAFGEFVQRYPQDPRVEDAELGIQSCYYRSGKDMEEYLQRRPDSALAADIFWNKGQDAFAAGDFTTAARAFEKVTLDHPGSESAPGALYYLAESYYRMEQLDAALAGYRNFSTTHPDHDLAELARFRTATVLFKLERYRESAREYEGLVDLFPQGEYAALAAFNASVCYQQVEDWTAAISGFQQFLERYPAHEKAAGLWVEIARLQQEELGDYQAAAASYERGLKGAEAPVAEIRYRQGQCHEKARELEAALASYEAAVSATAADDPFAIASLAQIAAIHEERGEWNAAIGAYERILRAGGKPEWTAMAQDRIDAIRETQVAGK